MYSDDRFLAIVEMERLGLIQDQNIRRFIKFSYELLQERNALAAQLETMTTTNELLLREVESRESDKPAQLKAKPKKKTEDASDVS